MIDIIQDFWALMMAFVAIVVWQVRLEARGLANEREIRRLWAQRREDMDVAKEHRDQQNAMLTEIRADVKRLLLGKE
jgi:hypothetical protein